MDDKKTKDYQFVKETTKKVPKNWKLLSMKLGRILIAAAIFGAAACFVFCLLFPVFEEHLAGRKNTVNLDEPEQTKEEQEPVIIQENKAMTLEDYENLENQLYRVGKDARSSVVEVSTVTEAKDWFDQDYEATGQGAGVILAETGSQILVLTEQSLIAGAKKLKVTFWGNSSAEAGLKSCDGNTGIAILSVEKRGLDSGLLEQIKPLQIGNAAGMTAGDFVVAVGRPLGSAGSVLTGKITATDRQVSAADRNYRVYMTDMMADTSAGGVVLNRSGELVGVITHLHHPRDSVDPVWFLPMSEVTALVEDLSNGARIPYLGVYISEVTKEISETYDLPRGIYIKRVDVDAPAMTAGLQAGDVVTKINGIEVLTERAWNLAFEDLKPDEKITVTVKRLGSANTYQDVECSAVIGTKK